MKILVTGGAGYIGSHTCVELINNGYEVIVVDNLSNSKFEVINRIEKITGKRVKFYEMDLLDEAGMRIVFEENKIEAVIHFAGYKAVGESVSKPLEYYYNNLTSTLILCATMERYGVNQLVFSSSATVYDPSNESPLDESMSLGTTNPYGSTKKMIEEILGDLYQSNNQWHIAILRYFNPIGAHSSGLIGENPNGIPNNLMPYITQVAVGKRDYLSVFGNDYNTPDGTGVRDYIHVVDLAKGHLKALEKINNDSGLYTYNLGTGRGYSVIEVIQNFEKASDIKIPYKITERRSGDVAVCFSNPSKALEELGWKTEYNLEQMCKDSWKWQKKNPQGYE